jgi:hypothetical protein
MWSDWYGNKRHVRHEESGCGVAIEKQFNGSYSEALKQAHCFIEKYVTRCFTKGLLDIKYELRKTIGVSR